MRKRLIRNHATTPYWGPIAQHISNSSGSHCLLGEHAANFLGVVPKWETGAGWEKWGWGFCGVTVLLNASCSGLRDLFRWSLFYVRLWGDLETGEYVPGQ